MGMQITQERMLRANVCEIERGLFHVAYRIDDLGPGRHLLPLYQVGTSEADAQKRVEQRARECGYDAVIWETMGADPRMFIAPKPETLRPNR